MNSRNIYAYRTWPRVRKISTQTHYVIVVKHRVIYYSDTQMVACGGYASFERVSLHFDEIEKVRFDSLNLFNLFFFLSLKSLF